MEEGKRIRLTFKDDDILTEAQKSDGLIRSWLLFKPYHHRTIADLTSHLLRAFQLHHSCPHGLLLSISGFVLPPFESSSILKDDEIIRVQKRKDIQAITGNNAANNVERLKAVEKQPVNNGVLLLANEEFEKEKGGYESDEPEEESEEDDGEDLLKDVDNPSGSNADKRTRKRKAVDKLKRPKGKKHRSDATGGAPNAVLTDNGKRDDSIGGDNVENDGEPSKLIDKSNVSGPSTKGTAEVQDNSKETDAKITPKETKKAPSRSARRKYAKRRWLQEMAKIQKQNATCESEGLRNWKEDQAKAGRKRKVDGQEKGQQKWKKHQADADGNVADDQPKGLLHWTPQDNSLVKGKKRKQRNQNNNFSILQHWNDDAHEQQIHTGDGLEQPISNGGANQLPNQKQGDSHERPVLNNAVVQECENQIYDASEQQNQESGEENEVVPIVIRPGHIRFEPLGEEQSVQRDHVPQETFQWNGITSKKKGQKWGKDSRPFVPRNDFKTSKRECNVLSNEKDKHADEGTKEKQADEGTKEKQAYEGADFDKLPLLLSTPKKGDIIAYRLLELSSSWTPELSPFRVGKVSWYYAESNQIKLVPVPEYPIVSEKDDEDETAQLDNSLYKEDGSLEIDFSSLIDVRIVNNVRSEPGNEATRCGTDGSVGDAIAPKAVLPSSSDKLTVDTDQDAKWNQGEGTQAPATENNGVNIWELLSESLNAKKEQLSKEKGWGKKASPDKSKSWSLRGTALGPTMSMLRAKKAT